jgi:hypothetical protein
MRNLANMAVTLSVLQDLLARDPEPPASPPPPDPRLMKKHFDNGDLYEGFHVQGRREGNGVCTYADGASLTRRMRAAW